MLRCNHDEEDEERRHRQQVHNAYQQYATFHQVREQGVNHRRERLISSMRAVEEGPSIKTILQKSFSQQQQKKNNELFCQATIRNQYFLDNALKHCGAMTSQELTQAVRQRNAGSGVEWATEDQVSKIDSVLKSVYRDWSMEGREERSVVYDKLLGALENYMPIQNNDRGDRGPPRVAVPGSGVARLAFEIYSKGYSSQGSDFSLPMLLASDFILNGCGGEGSSLKQFAISPFLSETMNVKSVHDRLRTVVVPDIDVSAVEPINDFKQSPDFTMLAGEFTSLYSHYLPGNRCVGKRQMDSDEKFDAVVCSFFIDTAPSLPHYLITIWHMLENGGLFVNMGPLMWHWSRHGCVIPEDVDSKSTTNGQGDFMSEKHKQRTMHLDQRYLQSVDFTWEEVRDLIVNCGFELLEEELDIRTRYTSDMSSMKKVDYDCVFFVARKVVPEIK